VGAILITGMSSTGTSTVLVALAGLGYHGADQRRRRAG
jgi:RNase adaptor protein for sRNA GlmZ degradation